MIHRPRPLTSLIFLLLLVAGSVGAQSVTLPFSRSGSLIGAQASLDGDEEVGFVLGVGYSIAGVLDLGIRFGADVVRSEEAVTSDIGMNYGFAPLKQSEGTPLSAQIYGSYTFRAENSDFLTRNGLVHEARGYTLAIALVRDSFLNETIGVRTGALVEYENYLETTTIGFDATGFTGTTEVDYAEFPRVERLSGFAYGGYIGAMFRTPRGGAILAGFNVLRDSNREVEFRPDVQLLMSR